jgi:hypothetical protein
MGPLYVPTAPQGALILGFETKWTRFYFLSHDEQVGLPLGVNVGAIKQGTFWKRGPKGDWPTNSRVLLEETGGKKLGYFPQGPFDDPFGEGVDAYSFPSN